MGMSDDEQPTHRIHWRASCDVQMHGRGFQLARTHKARVRQAGHCWGGGLIAERCHFGPRRLILEGEVDYIPPRWNPPRPSGYGHDLALAMVRWTAQILYGMHRDRAQWEMEEPANLRVEVRVHPLLGERVA
jgi:hypothetical protein